MVVAANAEERRASRVRGGRSALSSPGAAAGSRCPAGRRLEGAGAAQSVGMAFVHLHTHSEYSLLDGANRIPELVAHVKKLGMDSLAVTDHGNMHAAWSLLRAGQGRRRSGPILGFEAYLAFGPRQAREKPSWAPAAYSHLVLLAKNRAGYQNLVRLTSIGYTEGFYRRPRIDKEVPGAALARASSAWPPACRARSRSALRAGQVRRGQGERRVVRADCSARTGSGSRSSSTASPRSGWSPRGCCGWAGSSGIGVVATNDAHYLRREDAEAHDVLLAIGTGSDLDDPKRFRFTGQESYVKSEAEMRALFPDHPETLANTAAGGRPLRVRLREAVLPPRLPPPRRVRDRRGAARAPRRARAPSGATATPLPPAVAGAAGLRARRHQHGRLRRLLPDRAGLHRGRARARAFRSGPAAARRPARSWRTRSASPTSDPLKFDLLFERFLNPERVSMPDIDVDFCFERRGEVIEYVRERYGRASVGQIVTFGTMKARAAVKDVARVLRIPPGEADRITKLIPSGPAYSLTIPEAVQKVDELRELVQGEPGLPAAGGPELADRGDLAPHVGARRRRGDRPGPARRVRAGVHRAHQGRRGGRRRRGRHHHAVRDGRAGEGRHAQDGHARPQDAHRDPRRGAR